MLIVTDDKDNLLKFKFLDQTILSTAQLACFEELRQHKIRPLEHDIIILIAGNQDISYTLQYLRITSDAMIIIISDDYQNISKKYRHKIICFKTDISKEFFIGSLYILQNDSLKASHDISLDYIKTISVGKFLINQMAQIPSIAKAIAHSTNNSQHVCRGVYELLLNSFEHGIYQIGFNLKQELIAEKKYFSEINRRTQAPEFKNKFIELTLHKKEDATYINISDPGLGFNYGPYLKFNKNLAESSTGRGISYAANFCFDQLVYTDEGRSVSAVIKHN